jgi:hypothetical protein
MHRPTKALRLLAAAAVLSLTACATAPAEPVTVVDPAPQGPPPCPPLNEEPHPPHGWRYLEEITALCKADIYKAASAQGKREPKRQIAIETEKNVGILLHPTNVALKPATTLRWAWNVETLPSKVSEETAPTHDYLSIAVKFDNGQDLTYMWSAEMPAGKGFRCPLPTWDVRETHVVVRSGEKDLGRWLREERNILADYKKYVGGAPPKRVTEVWLIANTIFQQGKGAARVGNITLGGPKAKQRVRIL